MPDYEALILGRPYFPVTTGNAHSANTILQRKPIMAIDLSGIEAAAADFVVAEYENYKPQIEAVIASGESGIQNAVVSFIKANPSSGLVGLLISKVEGMAEAFVAAQVAKYGPDYLYTFLDTVLKAEATKLGG